MDTDLMVISYVNGTDLPTKPPFPIPKPCLYLVMLACKVRSAYRVSESVRRSLWPSKNPAEAKADAVANAVTARLAEIKKLPLGNEFIEGIRVIYAMRCISRLFEKETDFLQAYNQTYDAKKGTYEDRPLSKRAHTTLFWQEMRELIATIFVIVSNIWSFSDAVRSFDNAAQAEAVRSVVNDAVMLMLDNPKEEPRNADDFKAKITDSLRSTLKNNMALADRLMKDLGLKKQGILESIGAADAFMGTDADKTPSKPPVSDAEKTRTLSKIYQPVVHISVTA